jgi:hypothetical protein
MKTNAMKKTVHDALLRELPLLLCNGCKLFDTKDGAGVLLLVSLKIYMHLCDPFEC